MIRMQHYGHSCAWALVVVLGIAIAGCPSEPPMNGTVVNDNESNDNVNPPTDEFEWQSVLEDVPAALLSVAGTSATDVYVVGADPGDGLGPYVLHYDGQSWTRLTTGESGDLWWISVTPIDGSFYMTGVDGMILRYTPATGTFERQTTPGNELIYGIWGTDTNHIWAVGGDLAKPAEGGVLWQFIDGAWKVVDLSAVVADGVPTLFKVWGRDDADVYAVGSGGQGLHFDGTDWQDVDMGTTRSLFTVHGSDTLVAAVGGFGTGVIVELTGDSFEERATPGTLQMNGVFVPQDGPGVTVGIETSATFRTDDEWEFQFTGLASDLDYHAVWVDPDGGIWAVGGRIIADPPIEGIVGYFGAEEIGQEIMTGE